MLRRRRRKEFVKSRLLAGGSGANANDPCEKSVSRHLRRDQIYKYMEAYAFILCATLERRRRCGCKRATKISLNPPSIHFFPEPTPHSHSILTPVHVPSGRFPPLPAHRPRRCLQRSVHPSPASFCTLRRSCVNTKTRIISISGNPPPAPTPPNFNSTPFAVSVEKTAENRPLIKWTVSVLQWGAM